MDVEAVVASWLSGHCGIPAFLEMPPEDNDPGELITVERTGGGGGFLEPVMLDVDCWGAAKKERKRARAVADAIASAVPDLDGIPNVFGPKVENVYRMNDPDTERSRYVVSVSLWVCE